MAQYVISGGNQLRGKVRISGNKNSVLPCLAATLLTEDKVTLKNVPIIRDVGVSLQILQTLGAQTTSEGREVTVEAKKISQTELPKELVAKLRASILFVGPLLARLNKVTFSHPGGDIIGRRSIEPHHCDRKIHSGIAGPCQTVDRREEKGTRQIRPSQRS